MWWRLWFIISIYLPSKPKTQKHKQKVKKELGDSSDLELGNLLLTLLNYYSIHSFSHEEERRFTKKQCRCRRGLINFLLLEWGKNLGESFRGASQVQINTWIRNSFCGGYLQSTPLLNADALTFGWYKIIKPCEKHPWRSATFSKVAGFKHATLLEWQPSMGVFSRFLNCTNGTKSCNKSFI